jgi:hypothetical protein
MPVGRSEGYLPAIGDGYDTIEARAHRNKLDGFAVVDGLKVSEGSSGLEIDIASGTATVGESSGTVQTVSTGSTTTKTLNTADSTNPRKDTIYIDTNGDIQIEQGAAEAAEPSGNDRFTTYQPEPPLPSTEGTILAEVWVGAGQTSLQSADIRDHRYPADGVFDDVFAQALSTEQIGDDRHYAEAYSGADADARLDSAISAASTDDIIFLEEASYSSRTVSDSFIFKGVGGPMITGNDSRLTGDWTVNAAATIMGVHVRSSVITFNTNRSAITEFLMSGSGAEVVIDATACGVTDGLYISGNGVTFKSGSSNGMADSLWGGWTVTDSGSNTVGDTT